MASNDKSLTPMMRQFFSLKEKHPDAVLLFRCGDFYETYCDDAIEAARILGITLTHRNNGAGSKGKDEMAGFPYHALDTYLPRLIRAGRRVAICDQLEDPKLTKKLVKRGITELVTPGVAMSDNVLNGRENNFLAAVHFDRNTCGIAFLDISTGEFLTDEGPCEHVEKLLSNFQPKEVLYEVGRRNDFIRAFGAKFFTFELDDWVFTEQTARQKLLRHFGVKTLKGFGINHLHRAIIAAGAILHYLELTQHTQVAHINSISRIAEERYVRLDKFTLRALELLQPMHEDGQSLLDVIDRTVSPMGARMMRRWLSFPLIECEQIHQRLDIVEALFREPDLRRVLQDCFHRIGDLERIAGRVAAGRVSPREVAALKTAIEASSQVKAACLAIGSSPLGQLAEGINPLDDLHQIIAHQLTDQPPQMVAKGGVIREGVSEELDRLRQLAFSGKDYLMQIQQREAEQTHIPSLKIGYNNVFGYYLEVRNIYKDRVPDDWIRKQTLAQAERYITAELKQYEENILGAEERILALETQLFAQLVSAIRQFIPLIQANAAAIAQLDCLLSFAETADIHQYVRPVVNDSDVISIQQGRHPVIETASDERYIPNDIFLDTQKQQIIIITGPNMAGKSALLRQTALITLLAQVGSFVPAKAATIGIVDRIFTRVGATDNIARGESTFMVEMTEAAIILNNLSPRSLLLFDELGRGTSTYDGISIAWAIVEHLHDAPAPNSSRSFTSPSGAWGASLPPHPRTLFATHYHELNQLEHFFPRVKNYNVAVSQSQGTISFLHTLQRGPSAHSFGIHVAQMAGMPKSIIRRANTILQQLEQGNSQIGSSLKPSSESISKPQKDLQLSFFQLDDPVLSQVRDEILHLDIDNLTPVQALNKLNEIKKIVSGK